MKLKHLKANVLSELFSAEHLGTGCLRNLIRAVKVEALLSQMRRDKNKAQREGKTKP